MFDIYKRPNAAYWYYIDAAALDDERQDYIISNVVRLLVYRKEGEAASWLSSGIVDVRLSRAIGIVPEELSDTIDVLQITAPIDIYHYLRESVPNDENLKRIFEEIVSGFREFGHHIWFIGCQLETVSPPSDWHRRLFEFIPKFEIPANQALFAYRNGEKFVHKRLHFRSPAEICIFDELVTRQLLVLPLPVAVMGQDKAYLEPDFVVFYNGKAGVFEVHGKTYHTPETATKEHELRRHFARLGVRIFEVFDAQKCMSNPERVVDDFLAAFE